MQGREHGKEQDRWNQYGARQLRDIKENPDGHIIHVSPVGYLTAHEELARLLGSLQGKEVLELGCGLGDFSVSLAHQGAKVTAIDLGPDLIAAAKALAEVNRVDCDFRQGNITVLPFERDAFDVVIGLSVLHHLSGANVLRTLQEVARVLKADGMALFHEPVENSRLFALLQNLIPVGDRGGGHFRPSILQRKAWRHYVKTADDRDMTNQELSSAGKRYFRDVSLIPYGFLIRFERLIGGKYRGKLAALDAFLFRVFPPLRHYSQTVLVAYRK